MTKQVAAIELHEGNTTEMALIDEVRMELLSRMVDPEDAVGISIPILKINYVSPDEGSDHPRGSWVVGQTKDADGNVIEQGKLVTALVILSKRLRYSLYNRKDTTANCSSPMYSPSTPADQVRGNNYGFICGGACPFRSKDKDPRCKAQVVVFGTAYTPAGEGVDCMAYLQGASYMPISDYYRQLTKKRGKSGSRDVPPFYCLTLLGSEKAKFDSTVYFIGTFTQGQEFDADQLAAYEVRRNDVRSLIDELNAAHSGRKTPVATPVKEEPVVVNPASPELSAANADVPF